MFRLQERFCSSGLAGSYVDSLADMGITARMMFRPRHPRDPAPHIVEILDYGLEMSAHEPEQTGEDRKLR